MKITKANGKVEYALIDNLKKRAGETDAKIVEIVTSIINGVKEGGSEAVREYTVRFDGAVPKKCFLKKTNLTNFLIMLMTISNQQSSMPKIIYMISTPVRHNKVG